MSTRGGGGGHDERRGQRSEGRGRGVRVSGPGVGVGVFGPPACTQGNRWPTSRVAAERQLSQMAWYACAATPPPTLRLLPSPPFVCTDRRLSCTVRHRAAPCTEPLPAPSWRALHERRPPMTVKPLVVCRRPWPFASRQSAVATACKSGVDGRRSSSPSDLPLTGVKTSIFELPTQPCPAGATLLSLPLKEREARAPGRQGTKRGGRVLDDPFCDAPTVAVLTTPTSGATSAADRRRRICDYLAPNGRVSAVAQAQ